MIRLHVSMRVPSTLQAVVKQRTPLKWGLTPDTSVLYRDDRYRVPILAASEFSIHELRSYPHEIAQLIVMDRIRSLAVHEVLESLRVNGEPFYKDEVDALHP